MTSARPARSSARQSALRQQELDAELEAKQQRISQQTTERLEHSHRNSNHASSSNGRTNDEDDLESLASSSRSLSPALSDSASLSSEDHSSTRRTTAKAHEKEEDDQDPSKPFSDPDLHSSWEIALVFGFLIKFRLLLRQICPLRELSIEDLETGLLAKSSNDCIEEVHANLLSNMLNRKKAVDSTTWQKVLSETLDTKYRTGEIEYDQNPLRYYGNYYLLPPQDRIHILKALVHWVLQEGTVIRQGLEDDNEYYIVEPFGTDASKRVYWYFGEGTLRVFRETKSPKKKSGGSWETVARTLDEIKALAGSFDRTSSKPEKVLQERLREEIIEPTEERILQNKLKQERLEKRMHRLAELHQLAATRTTRTRSSNRLNQPKYTYEEDEDEFAEDEYDLYRRPSSRRRHNNHIDGLEHDTATSAPSTFVFAGSEGHVQASLGDFPADNKDAIPLTQEGDQDQQWERDRSASVEDASSSARSSVGRDSDSSIRVALQRTRVGEDDEDEYKFEEDRDVDEESNELSLAEQGQANHAEPAAAALSSASVSVPPTTPAPAQDVAMKPAGL